MLDDETLQQCGQDYQKHRGFYLEMLQYYCGDTDAMRDYKTITKRANNKVHCNFLQKFINEEASYCVGNRVTYISHSGDTQEIEDIRLTLKNWHEQHNRELCKEALIFNEAYELYYTDKDGQFASIVCNPLDSYLYMDENNNIIAFIRFFKKKFDATETKYADVYTDTDIVHYKFADGSFAPLGNVPDDNVFGSVPVGVCSIGNVFESLYNTIKGLQDGYETNLSDIVNEISDFRNAYLVLVKCQLDDKKKDENGETDADKMKKNGIIDLPDGGSAAWLTKNINDSFIQNTLSTLEDKMYQLTSHINNNEKMVSNTSSLALRNRLIGLEQRCANNIEALTDCLTTRIKFLFNFLQIKSGKFYDWRDVDIKFTPCIPTDDQMMAQIISQLNGKLSTKTALAQLSFVNNPDSEMAELKKEQQVYAIGAEKLNNAQPPNNKAGDAA